MESSQDHLKQVAEIKTMMERSTRFMSLSGLSGIFAGVFALAGAALAVYCLRLGFPFSEYLISGNTALRTRKEVMLFLILDATIVLFISFAVSTYLTVKRAASDGKPVWTPAAKRLFINLMIPLVAGGVFCLIAYFRYGYIGIIAPLMLVFYGLALINASKYTLDDVRFLGLAEVVLGICAFYFIGYGFLFWCVGFGILHIIYGAWMWNKYERINQ